MALFGRKDCYHLKTFSKVQKYLLCGHLAYLFWTKVRSESGEKLNSERKSLSYSLTYRNSERTLKSEEVDKEHQEILEKLKANLDVSFR